MSTHRFTQLDVFTDTPLLGNPLAVVHDAQALGDAQMKAFARWTSLSETAFLLPPTDPRADYRVRIFTPAHELLFAGHPTLGSCHAWLQAGGLPKRVDEIVQECGVGLVRVRRDGTRLAFAAPAVRRGGAVDAATLARIAGSLRVPLDAIRASQWVDNGPGFVAVMLGSHAELMALQPDFAAMAAGPTEIGVVAPTPAGHAAQFEVRAFIASGGPTEDPVTGSLNAGIAQWLIGAGIAPERYVAAQGTCLRREGRLFIERIDGQVWVGGHSTDCIRGDVTL